MLRSSILYAAETYYNLREGEIRAIERMFSKTAVKNKKRVPNFATLSRDWALPCTFRNNKKTPPLLKRYSERKPK